MNKSEIEVQFAQAAIVRYPSMAFYNRCLDVDRLVAALHHLKAAFR